MPSTISYAGTDLIIEATPEVNDWVEAHIRPADLYEDTFNLGTLRPWLWYDWPTKVRVGEVVWPNGAQRWGYAHFYAGQTEVDAILATTGGEGYFDLVLDANNATSTPVTFSMAMLPPRPLSRFGDVSGQQEPLYLLTFVDKRFYWWQNHVENVVINEGTTTWAQLFTAMEVTLGEAFTQDAIPVAYGTPSRMAVPQGVPVPVLFDCWAYWTGRRVILDKDGTVFVSNPTTCSTVATANSITSGLLSGGRFPWKAPDSGSETNTEVLNSFLPDSCSLLFPVVQDGSSTPRVYAVLKTMADAAIATLSGITGDGAPYSYYYPLAANVVSGSATPTNSVALAALATQANVDFYSFQLGFLDQQESGTRNYSPDGLHRIEWLFTSNYAATHIVREALPPPGSDLFLNKSTSQSTPPGCNCFDFDVEFSTCFSPPVTPTTGPSCICFEFDSELEVCWATDRPCVCFNFDCEFETCFEAASTGGGGSTTTQTIQRDATATGSYNNVSVPTVNLWSITPTGGPVVLTGLDFGGTDGKHVEIRNDAASPVAGAAPLTITLPNLSSSSSSANQISSPDGRNIYIDPNASVHLKYDATRGKVIQLDPKCCKGSSGGGPGSGGGTSTDSSTSRSYTNTDNGSVVNRTQTGSGTDTFPYPPNTPPGYTVQVYNRGTGSISNSASGGATINGSSTYTIPVGGAAQFRSDGTNYTALPLGLSNATANNSVVSSGTGGAAYVTIFSASGTALVGRIRIWNTNGAGPALDIRTTYTSAYNGAVQVDTFSGLAFGNNTVLTLDSDHTAASYPFSSVTVEIKRNGVSDCLYSMAASVVGG